MISTSVLSILITGLQCQASQSNSTPKVRNPKLHIYFSVFSPSLPHSYSCMHVTLMVYSNLFPFLLVSDYLTSHENDCGWYAFVQIYLNFLMKMEQVKDPGKLKIRTLVNQNKNFILVRINFKTNRSATNTKVML